jgi:D-alanyl-D-alanine carboxypeptidase
VPAVIARLLLAAAAAAFLAAPAHAATGADHVKALRHAHARAVSAAIVVDGKTTWTGVRGAGVRASNVFSLASVTKPYVAALTLRLADEGRLALDDTVARWLGGAVPAAAGAVTVRELLGHTSGLPDYLEDAGVERALEDPRHAWTEAELLHAVRAPSGRGDFAYSNTNYILLGAIARRAAGVPTERALATFVLGPLGLGSTSLGRTQALARRVAGGGRLPNDVWSPLFTDGGVVATAGDVARFFDALLAGGRVLRPATLDLMLAPGPDGSYGLGVYSTRLRGRTVFGHDGTYDVWNTEVLTDRATHTTIAVLLRGGTPESADATLRALAALR